jgi:hypothetical protein
VQALAGARRAAVDGERRPRAGIKPGPVALELGGQILVNDKTLACQTLGRGKALGQRSPPVAFGEMDQRRRLAGNARGERAGTGCPCASR